MKHLPIASLAALNDNRVLFLVESWDRPDPNHPRLCEWLVFDQPASVRGLVSDLLELDDRLAWVSRVYCIRFDGSTPEDVTQECAEEVLTHMKSYGDPLPWCVRSFCHEHIGVMSC